MTLTTLSILSIFLAAASVISCYIPRVPSVVAAWLGLLCAHFAGAFYVDGNVLLFWGIASAIVLMLNVLQPKALSGLRAGTSYIATGTIVGTALGFILAPAVAAIIIGGAAGAFLGCLAFSTLPKGPKMSIASSEFIQYLCAKGLPCVVSCSQAAIVLISLL